VVMLKAPLRSWAAVLLGGSGALVAAGVPPVAAV